MAEVKISNLPAGTLAQTKADGLVPVSSGGATLAVPVSELADWNGMDNKPPTFPPSPHQHAKADITDFSHNHAIADVAGLQNELGIMVDALNAHAGDADIHFSDADADGKLYGRKDGAWEEIDVSPAAGAIETDATLTGDGTTATPLAVAISATAGNALESKTDGLFVPTAAAGGVQSVTAATGEDLVEVGGTATDPEIAATQKLRDAVTAAESAMQPAAVATAISGAVSTHDAAPTAHADIRLEIDEARAIAEGRSRARVFADVAEMEAWIAIAANVAELNIGDNLLIIDRGVPDFWWDGTQPRELETEKVDLTDYYTKTQVDLLLASKLSIATFDAVMADIRDELDDADTHIADNVIHVTQADKDRWDAREVKMSTRALFPPAGDAAVLYVATDEDRAYRWNGTAYVALTDVVIKPRAQFPPVGDPKKIYVDTDTNTMFRFALKPHGTTDTFTDERDGKTYRTVVIGEQEWFAENLNYDAPDSWLQPGQFPADKFGRLYTWQAAMDTVPAGWRLPTREDWQVLVDLAGGENVAGGKLKTTSGWTEGGNGTDDFGFSALPGGCGNAGSVNGQGLNVFSFFWSATEDVAGKAWGMRIYVTTAMFLSYVKTVEFSVRLVRPAMYYAPLGGSGTTITIDAEPTQDSDNAVKSGGVFAWTTDNFMPSKATFIDAGQFTALYDLVMAKGTGFYCFNATGHAQLTDAPTSASEKTLAAQVEVRHLKSLTQEGWELFFGLWTLPRRWRVFLHVTHTSIQNPWNELATTDYVDTAVARDTFVVSPDYVNAETTSRISTDNGSWTVDRDGFVRVQAATNGAGRFTVFVNGKVTAIIITPAPLQPGDVILQVKRGDVVRAQVSNGTFQTLSVYFIPPRYTWETSPGTPFNVRLIGQPKYDELPDASETVARPNPFDPYVFTKSGYVNIEAHNNTSLGRFHIFIGKNNISGDTDMTRLIGLDPGEKKEGLYPVSAGDALVWTKEGAPMLGTPHGFLRARFISPVSNAPQFITDAAELVIDQTPTQGSENPVSSGGVKTYVDSRVQETITGNIVYNLAPNKTLTTILNEITANASRYRNASIVIAGDSTYAPQTLNNTTVFNVPQGVKSLKLYNGESGDNVSVISGSGTLEILGHKGCDLLWAVARSGGGALVIRNFASVILNGDGGSINYNGTGGIVITNTTKVKLEEMFRAASSSFRTKFVPNIIFEEVSPNLFSLFVAEETTVHMGEAAPNFLSIGGNVQLRSSIVLGDMAGIYVFDKDNQMRTL